MTGRDYWRMVLRPWARDGHHSGILEDHAVVLFDEVGHEVHLSRPSAGWLPASLVVPAMEPDEHDPEVRRGVLYLMRSGSNRLELEV
jgi:hypothetical protein